MSFIRAPSQTATVVAHTQKENGMDKEKDGRKQKEKVGKRDGAMGQKSKDRGLNFIVGGRFDLLLRFTSSRIPLFTVRRSSLHIRIYIVASVSLFASILIIFVIRGGD